MRKKVAKDYIRIMIEMRFIAISIVSWSAMLVKRLVTLYKTKNLPERFAFLIWETKKSIFARLIIR